MNNKKTEENNNPSIPIIIYIDYINAEYHKYLNNEFKNLTPRDFTYLTCIYYNENISQRQLANLLIVSEANVGQIIKRLEKNELITRKPDTKNKSRRIINLTKKGETLVISLIEASQKWESQFFENYEAEDEQKFKQMISDYYQKSKN